MKAIGIWNQKGGVAKTSTAINLAAGIKLLKPASSILLIEADSQGSIKVNFRIKDVATSGTFASFLIDGSPINKEQLHKIQIDKSLEIDVLLASKRLSEADYKMINFPRREETLRIRFKEADCKWDYVIIDCAPALNMVTQNVLTFVDHLLIPATMDPFAAPGIQAILEQASVVEKYYDKKVNILGVLPTIFDQRTKMSFDILNMIKGGFRSLRIFEPIGVDARMRTAQLRQKTIYHFSGESRAAEQYLALSKQILQLIDGQNDELADAPIKMKKRTKRELNNESANV